MFRRDGFAYHESSANEGIDSQRMGLKSEQECFSLSVSNLKSKQVLSSFIERMIVKRYATGVYSTPLEIFGPNWENRRVDGVFVNRV